MLMAFVFNKKERVKTKTSQHKFGKRKISVKLQTAAEEPGIRQVLRGMKDKP